MGTQFRASIKKFLLTFNAELPNGNTDVTELAFRMLQNYLSIHVKSYDSGLYKEVTTKLIKESVELPQWLLDEFKVTYLTNAVPYLIFLFLSLD